MTPAFLDGPLAGTVHEVDDSVIDAGSYAFQADAAEVGQAPPSVVFYTFARVQMLNRVIVVASAKNGILPYDVLFDALASPAAKAAAE
jgi:hypothetical protein